MSKALVNYPGDVKQANSPWPFLDSRNLNSLVMMWYRRTDSRLSNCQ